MRAAHPQLVAVGFVGGVAAGSLLWTRVLRAHRHDLFSPQRMSRFAALGYLRGRPTVATVQLLREYIAWEPSAALRKRGARLLNRVEAAL